MRLSEEVENHRVSVVPVYRGLGQNLVHDGSMVLLSAFGKYWCVSAAHVLLQKVPLYLGGRPFQIMEEERVIHNASDLDLAFFEIAGRKAIALIADENRFLPLAETDSGPSLDEPQACVLSGYPERVVDIEYEGERQIFTLSPLRMSTVLWAKSRLESIRRGQASALNPIVHLAANAGKLHEDETGERIKKLNFHGLSGGAIWTRRPGSSAKLFGIVTGYDPKYGVVTGSRIGPLLARMSEQQ